MIRVQREHIAAVKDALYNALNGATTTIGHKINIVAPPDGVLERSAMLAIQSAAMEVFGVNDIAIPSDVAHRVNIGRDLIFFDSNAGNTTTADSL